MTFQFDQFSAAIRAGGAIDAQDTLALRQWAWADGTMGQAEAEAFVVGQTGKIVVRSSQKEVAADASRYVVLPFEEPAVLAASKARSSGHVELEGGRLALFSRLDSVGWTYVVIGSMDRILAVSIK